MVLIDTTGVLLVASVGRNSLASSCGSYRVMHVDLS